MWGLVFVIVHRYGITSGLHTEFRAAGVYVCALISDKVCNLTV